MNIKNEIIYVYAPSLSILGYVARRWEWNKITIITNNEQIALFCRKSKISVIRLNLNSNLSYRGLVEYRNYLIETANKFSNCTFIFGHFSHDYWGLFFIKCIGKNNNSIYFETQFEDYSKQSFFRSIASKKGRRLFFDILILYIITRQKFIIFSFNKILFLGLNVRHIKRKYKSYSITFSKAVFQSNQNHTLNLYGIDNIRLILLDQGEVLYKYTQEIIHLFIDISSNYKSIYLKQHPHFKTQNLKILNNLNQIPAEIPAELLLTDKTIIIGIASTSMKFSPKCISIIKMVEIEPDLAIELISFLDSENIHYPRTIEEFKKDLKKLMRKTDYLQ